MSRLDRLTRLHWLAMVSELMADPCTPERRIRAQRASRIAQAVRDERAQQTPSESCGVCGRPGRENTGLCDRCQDSHDAEQAALYVHQYGGPRNEGDVAVCYQVWP